jgi:tetratricopeptide (TPR) repeat protein
VLYLAVRAGRRAVAANPVDAQAHAVLGEAYLRLARDTRERHWGRAFSELLQLRRAQATTALAQAVALNPDLARAHFQLAGLFAEMGFLDLAVQHQRDAVAAMRRGAAAADQRAGVIEAEAGLDRLVRVADEQEAVFARDAAGMRVYDRALLAKDLGLIGKARDILLGSDISAFGAAGLALELELLVRTGRVKEARDWTAAEHGEALGPLYEWLRVQAFAAGGDYALAREELGRLVGVGLDPSTPERPGAGIREVTAGRVGLAVLDGLPGPPGHRIGPVWQAFREADFRARLGQYVAAVRRQADTFAIRGLLALEEGDTESAVVDLRRALRIWTSADAVREGSGIDFNGRLAAQQALDWIESVPPGPAL